MAEKTASGLSMTVLKSRPAASEPRSALAQLDRAVAMLAAASTLEEVGHIRNMAKAAEAYARAEKLGDEAVGYANEIKLRAARKAGALLIQMAESGERMPEGGALPRTGNRETSDRIATLASLGVAKHESKRWQHIAAVPDEQFEEAVANRVSETALAKGHTVRPSVSRNGVPLGNTKRTGLKPSFRLQKLVDALAAMAAGLPLLDLRGEDCSTQLAEMDKHLLAIRRAIRHLQEGS